LPQWQWLSEITPKGSRVLSLFAHSGAATLALAQAGAEVVHVDSSRQSLQLARRNATASHLDSASIRWICEDAQRFVARERTRGNVYDGFVLDPPSWGHGPKGEAFSIDRHLVSLLTDCAQLLSPTAQGTNSPHCTLPWMAPSATGNSTHVCTSNGIIENATNLQWSTFMHGSSRTTAPSRRVCSLEWHWGHITIRWVHEGDHRIVSASINNND
jgi:hypothetical protein